MSALSGFLACCWGDAFGSQNQSAQNNSNIYWTPARRRKNRREIYEERVKLGILPKPLPKAVVKAAEKVAEKAKTERVFETERPQYEAMFMDELHVTKWMPDYSRAISIALAIRAREIRDQDDEEVLFLL